MKILISPAKSLDFKSEIETFSCSQPKFFKQAEVINNVLKEKSPSDLKNLQNISEKLADLNWTRNNEFNLEHNNNNSRPALFAFNGDVYDGIDAKSLTVDKVNTLQNQLRILSGLYGMLKPLDLIQPYRLEMGTKLTVNGSKNLYDFWADSITKELIYELEKDSIILNLASNEYFNAINKKIIDYNIISPVFKDFKNGKLKVISFYAKKARGLMVRYLVDNNITKYEEILSFNSAGYTFSDEHTENANSPVFIR